MIQSCGECKFYIPDLTRKPSQWGYCEFPLPSAIIESTTFIENTTSVEKGSSCQCYQRKEIKNK